jgi:hypothetical protein
MIFKEVRQPFLNFYFDLLKNATHKNIREFSPLKKGVYKCSRVRHGGSSEIPNGNSRCFPFPYVSRILRKMIERDPDREFPMFPVPVCFPSKNIGILRDF